MNKEKIGAYAILSVVGFFAWVLSIFLRGFALIWLWAWFVVPFGLLMGLSFAHALGISATVAFLTYEFNTTKDDEDEPGKTFFISVFKSIFVSLAALFFGFIYQLFM